MSACCFTGHRSLPEEEEERLVREIRPLLLALIREGTTEFRVGGAIGFDTLMGELLLRLRDEEHLPIRIVSMIPYPQWRGKWAPRDRERQEILLRKSDRVVYIRPHYRNGVYFLRNRALVDGARTCIAYCTKPTGGSAWTIRYAKQQGLTVYNTDHGIHEC